MKGRDHRFAPAQLIWHQLSHFRQTSASAGVNLQIECNVAFVFALAVQHLAVSAANRLMPLAPSRETGLMADRSADNTRSKPMACSARTPICSAGGNGRTTSPGAGSNRPTTVYRRLPTSPATRRWRALQPDAPGHRVDHPSVFTRLKLLDVSDRDARAFLAITGLSCKGGDVVACID